MSLICSFDKTKNRRKFYKEKDAFYHKVRDHCHNIGKFRGAAQSICNLRYKAPKKIIIVFHNGSTYDYHFIIKQLLAEDFQDTEKYITFSESIKEDDNSKKITYKLKFINSYRFMNNDLSNLVDNLSEINKKECPECRGNVNLSDLKMIDYIINAKNVKKDVLCQKMD